MTDIVERLRACANHELEFTPAEHLIDVPPRWCREAADEIEALRADLDKSANSHIQPSAPSVAMIEAYADELLVGHRAADYIPAAIKAREGK
jgi:hypothetical protein